MTVEFRSDNTVSKRSKNGNAAAAEEIAQGKEIIKR
jgi:hypothetical protein